MKAILIFSIILIAAVLVFAAVAGFVYGILKRGREVKRLQRIVDEVEEKANLYSDMDSVLAFDVRNIISKSERTK